MPHVCDQLNKYHQQSLRNQNSENAIQIRDSYWMQLCINTWQMRNCGWVQRLKEISLFSFGFFSLTLYLYFRNCACHRPLQVIAKTIRNSNDASLSLISWCYLMHRDLSTKGIMSTIRPRAIRKYHATVTARSKVFLDARKRNQYPKLNRRHHITIIHQSACRTSAISNIK